MTHRRLLMSLGLGLVLLLAGCGDVKLPAQLRLKSGDTLSCPHGLRVHSEGSIDCYGPNGSIEVHASLIAGLAAGTLR